MTVRIVTDSTSDLPAEMISDLGITIVPAYITLNGKAYRDGIDISQDEIYRRMVDLDQAATTSQPPPSDFVNVFNKLLKGDDNIISIQVTGKLSGIYNSALQAKHMMEDHNRIAVVDSESVSMGLGLITTMAARLALSGNSFKSILDEIKNNIARTHIWAIFDTLKYLHKGGRIGKAKALLGSVLNIKPLLTMKNGEINPVGVARTRIKAIDKLYEMADSFSNIQDMAVVHSSTPQDASKLKERLNNLFQGPIHISRLGPALGVHGGPGTLVLALREKAESKNDGIKAEVVEKKFFNLPSLPEIRLPKLRFSLL
jgi:DegV family protein with EDD domain